MQEDYDDEVEHSAIQSIYDRARNKEDQPFFQLISFTSPHTPFTVSEEYWNRYSPDEIDSPAVSEIPFENLDYHSKALFFAHGRHRHKVTKDHLRDTRHAYYGMISYIDDKIGRILATLDKTGLSENTTVLFTSDHGEMLGERGMWFKQAFWEWSAHVPLIARMPNTPKGRRIKETVSLVDLLPSFLDIANRSDLVPQDADGTSLIPFLKKTKPYHPNIAISDYLAIGPCVPCRMIRKDRFKLIRTYGHPNLLFDLVNDPNEMHNLASDPIYSDTMIELIELSNRDWDPHQLETSVRDSQKQRKIIKSTPGPADKWDHIARIGDDIRYVRADGVDATKGRLRLPQVPEVAPNWPTLEKDIITDLIAGKRNIADYLT
jgi:choline-sulfatase